MWSRAVLAAGLLALVALPGAPSPLTLVATTSILGDVVRQVAGEEAELVVLLPPDTDPHTFEPTPREIALLARADLVFICGAGLEEALEQLLSQARRVVDLSLGLELRTFPDGRVDPHVWLSPLNVALWAEGIAAALASLDPDHAADYQARAQAYQEELRTLDAWIQTQVEKIPEDRRLLVVDHLAFGYFCDRYGFRQLAILPGFSTLAEPSARELARLEREIQELSVPAIFVAHTTASPLVDQVARDTGVAVVYLYVGALSGPDGPAPSYLELMRYNVSAIVAALGGG